jgi:hypothetical protein
MSRPGRPLLGAAAWVLAVVAILSVIGLLVRRIGRDMSVLRLASAYDRVSQTSLDPHLAPRLGVLQIENRHAPMIDAFIAHNTNESVAQGFEHVVSREGVESAPPYWWKVFGLKRLMAERPDLDLVMWLDSDAYMSPSAAQRIHLLAEDREKVMWLSPDCPRFPSPFCAGAFVVRNDERGRWLVDTWLSHFDPSRWTKDETNGSWRCLGPWAGPDYEQGAFSTHLLPLADRIGISVQSWQTFSEVDCDSPSKECAVIHLAGEYKDERGECCVAGLRTSRRR